jgi:uncharacterized damage-inducible protein DinB
MTTTAGTRSLFEAAYADLAHELRTTRRVLERVPGEHLAWRPHERSMSLAELATHIANVVFWLRVTAERSEFDLASMPPRAAAASRDELIRLFDDNVAALEDALAALDDAALAEDWTLLRGGTPILRQPRGALLRMMGISHLVHHRGQLAVYLRLLDVPVPAIYGPSADEQGGA